MLTDAVRSPDGVTPNAALGLPLQRLLSKIPGKP